MWQDWQDVSLEGVTLDSLPLFNHSRSGCRPFVEVFANGARLSSSYSSYHELAFAFINVLRMNSLGTIEFIEPLSTFFSQRWFHFFEKKH